MKSLPNILTASRIVVIPFILVLLALDVSWASWTALGLYSYACITDFLDGYLARKMGVVSAIGRFLDPIADKLLIVSLLLLLGALDRLDGWWIVPAVIILAREIFISGLREFLGPMNVIVPVSQWGKWKTTSQMVCLGFLIMGAHAPLWIPSLLIGHVLLTIAAIMAVISGAGYTKAALPHFKQ